MNNLENFARKFLVKEYDNVMTYQYENRDFWYYTDTEIWEIPRSLEPILDEEEVDLDSESIEWIEG